MPDLQRFTTGNPWERSVGFSRAVRVGDVVYTAGTIASDEHGQIHGESAYDQCCYIFAKLGRVLEEAGSSLDRVFKVVCYLVDLADADDFTRAHAEHLGQQRPATTCVAVRDLFGEGSRVEIELTALVRSRTQDWHQERQLGPKLATPPESP